MKVLNEQQLQYVFYHELAHIKRNDVAVNWIMYSLIILNWFNQFFGTPIFVCEKIKN